jgi:lipopolysaccharide export system protein LptA
MTKTICQLLILFLTALLAWQAKAADTPLGNSDGPITITADHMTADDNSQIVIFTGRVIARQDDLIITCDLMRVHYQTNNSQNEQVSTTTSEPEQALEKASQGASEDNAAVPEAPVGPLEGNQEIYRVDCEGSVKIQQGDKLAVGDKAMYLAKSEPRRLILTGQARVWEGKNSVTGHQVVYYLDQNRSQVDSRDNQRVRAFYDKADSETKN